MPAKFGVSSCCLLALTQLVVVLIVLMSKAIGSEETKYFCCMFDVCLRYVYCKSNVCMYCIYVCINVYLYGRSIVNTTSCRTNLLPELYHASLFAIPRRFEVSLEKLCFSSEFKESLPKHKMMPMFVMMFSSGGF